MNNQVELIKVLFFSNDGTRLLETRQIVKMTLMPDALRIGSRTFFHRPARKETDYFEGSVIDVSASEK